MADWQDDTTKGRKSYHHGNLKEALLAAARELIGEKGPAGFTFAEAARRAGVSPAAPYRHFKDRDALIENVAEAGFDRFRRDLLKGWNEGRPDPYSAYCSLGRAYLSFAERYPAEYQAMFESGLPMTPGTSLCASADAAFEVLRNATAVLCTTLPAEKRPPVMMMSLHVWSVSHGIASLFARGDEARRPTPISPEDLLESAVLIYLQGLGLSPSR